MYAVQADHPSVYIVAGFLVVWFRLGANYNDKAKQLNNFSSPGGRGGVQGAALGWLAGLVTYPVFYLWPEIITGMPGTVPLLISTMRVMEWLNSFWLVRLIIGFLAIGYLLNLAFLALMGTMMAYVGMKSSMAAKPAAGA